MTRDPDDWLAAFFEIARAHWCELSANILLRSTRLPGQIHGDPADRIIAATARHSGHTLLTRDRRLLAYGRAGHIRALAC